jgi:hypothetical protein
MRFILFSLVVSSSVFSQSAKSWDHEKIEVKDNLGSNVMIGPDAIFKDQWQVLPQAMFWKQIMKLSPDSCLINVASTRVVLLKLDCKKWNRQTEAQKGLFKDSLRKLNNLPQSEQLFVTSGKSDFYLFDDVYPSISRGVSAFELHGVDPWYAQAILLIESPGQLKKSCAGAYGPFQLMPGVARAQGLIVTKTLDERKDFDLSAKGSARLISRICIPEAKKILNAHHLSYNESDLWFRLFVMHVYHAGAMNVRAVVDKIDPANGSQELIIKMWQTSAAAFGNSSQNYTQLVLASQLILNEMVADSSRKYIASAFVEKK